MYQSRILGTVRNQQRSQPWDGKTQGLMIWDSYEWFFGDGWVFLFASCLFSFPVDFSRPGFGTHPLTSPESFRDSEGRLIPLSPFRQPADRREGRRFKLDFALYKLYTVLRFSIDESPMDRMAMGDLNFEWWVWSSCNARPVGVQC